ncbi:MAG: hypothetical protein KDC38_00310 [Planctomycetes bacterium]|nr:hypothetical protein [Planctomycetota bacterium]
MIGDIDADGQPDLVRGAYHGFEVTFNETLDPPDCDYDGVADVDEPDLDGDGIPDDCQGLSPFRRGDCNRDGSTDIADPIYVELYLFLSGATPACLDACDTNDDGTLNIADSIYLLTTLFSGGALPPSPFDVCGPDPTADPLTCESYPDPLCP